MKIARATTARDRNLGVGFWSAYLPTGFSLMLLAAPLLMQDYGWRGLWGVNAAIAGGYALLFLFATSPRRWPEGQGGVHGQQCGNQLNQWIAHGDPNSAECTFA